jgi:large subunit ribosomal protein L28
MTGNNVSHSKRRTNRRFLPNLHAVTIMRGNRPVSLTACTRCIRTQSKAPR